MRDAHGRWTLVTGASRGIGREMALALAAEGANVVVHSRTLEASEAVAAQVRERGVDALAVAADLADPAQVRRLADDVLGRVEVDLLFCNAGVQPPSRDPWWQADAAQYVDTYLVNVVAPMLLVEKLVPGMLERGFGRITHTTSGILHQPEQGAYAASKGALNKATLDAAARLAGTGVTVNVADPGWIRTDLGGPHAPNAVDTVVPGMILGGFLGDDVNGCWINAQDFTGLTLDEAVGAAPGKVLRLAVTA